jgi:hypothetical protein
MGDKMADKCNARHGWIPDNHAYSVISGMTVMEVLLRYLDTSIPRYMCQQFLAAAFFLRIALE